MNPYKIVPSKGYWKQSVSEKSPFDISDLWGPKFKFGPKTPIATFGSCFAQHFAKALVKRNWNWIDAEPAPKSVSDDIATRFGYRQFSARTANIYTPSLLLQWLSWAFGDTKVPEEVWMTDGRFFDPFRPRIEPDGFDSPEAIVEMRQVTLASLRECVARAKVFVFTLGLTESWFHRDGYEYPMCPGTAGGEFDAGAHLFVNQQFDQVSTALEKVISFLRRENPLIQILLTVSPLPLVATNSGEHVLLATMHSKSVLRAVAGEVSKQHDFVDYFPSYEVISAPPFQGIFFNPDKRSVNQAGVKFVMDRFFEGAETLRQRSAVGVESSSAELAEKKKMRKTRRAERRAKAYQKDISDSAYEVACDEEVLAAFGGKS